VNSIVNAAALERLVQRLTGLTPDTPRQWGTMTPGEMLCHLGDSAASVLDRPGGATGRSHRIKKWLALYTSLPWPRDLGTPPSVNPRLNGTRPGDFEADRARAIAGLHALAAADPGILPRSHGHFGRMSAEDWQHWAYRHTDHHLRQFGL
jgi:hypothetical protein